MRGGIVGLDIGGAHIKAAHSDQTALCRKFALWKQPEALSAVLRDVLAEMPPFDLVAVSMTGEICDCFASKRAGVNAILDALEQAVQGRPVVVWQTTGHWLSVEEARLNPMTTAAANWHALATFAGRFAADSSHAFVVDVGSTTTDIVRLRRGKPVPIGRTDFERLRTRELVYTGIRRTPVCALLDRVAAEWFATTHDAFLLLGWIEEDESDTDTPDGRPATKGFAHARLARMVGADAETLSLADAQRLAKQIIQRQLARIADAIRNLSRDLNEPPLAILSGSGEFLARRACKAVGLNRFIYLSKELGEAISRSACAYSLAVLAAEGGIVEEMERRGA
ncbi:MAG: tetrahydromethanopterin-linked C1 transfer pathway [Gemmatales bacterium]|nr:MAG: tetrahydromethanopterin-linked C1 transfer pathway [Gemmatales bacterium]